MDPGFPVQGGGGGTPTSDAGTFCENVCKNKRIGSSCGEGGGGVRQKISYVDRPL